MDIKNIIKILLYVFFSSFGLILLKMGTNKELNLSWDKGNFTVKINYILIIGMLLYILSFLTSLVAMKGMNLSLFYPISAGLVYVLVCFLSWFWLKEKISTQQMVGMGIIFIGVIIMNIRKA